jgi:hypothetical protein
MQENRDDLVSIVVLEAGASWPAWLSEYQRLAPNAVVIAQAATETVPAFEKRVLHRVAEASANGVGRIRVGGIIAADRGGEAQAALRHRLAGALLQAMSSHPESELVLAGENAEAESTRQELFALAGALCGELGGKRVNVCVRFSNKRSGTMRSVTSSSPDGDGIASKI